MISKPSAGGLHSFSRYALSAPRDELLKPGPTLHGGNCAREVSRRERLPTVNSAFVRNEKRAIERGDPRVAVSESRQTQSVLGQRNVEGFLPSRTCIQ